MNDEELKTGGILTVEELPDEDTADITETENSFDEPEQTSDPVPEEPEEPAEDEPDAYDAEPVELMEEEAPRQEQTPQLDAPVRTPEKPVKAAPKVKHTKKKRRGRRLRIRISRKRAGILLAVVLVVLAVVLIRVYSSTHVSSKYSVLDTAEREGSVNSSYETFSGQILHYSSDGAALTGTDGTAIWNETFDMDTPILDMDDSIAAIYDQKGTDIYVFDSKGVVGKVSTDKSILKVRVSSQGMLAAILEDGDTTWINFYSTSGETIATAKTRIDSPGYPVDLDVSQNGKLLAVSYLYVDGDTPTSYVAFYNFSEAGKSQMDNVVSAYTYSDVMVPQIRFMSGNKAAAIRDNGIMLYTGSEIPAESYTVDEDDEILSCFAGDTFIGLVTNNKDEKSTNPYVMSIYDLKGKRIARREFSGDYTTIRVDDDMIFLYNDRQLCIFNNKGHETFQGVITEGSVQDVCRVSSDRFLIVMSDKIETIKVK